MLIFAILMLHYMSKTFVSETFIHDLTELNMSRANLPLIFMFYFKIIQL